LKKAKKNLNPNDKHRVKYEKQRDLIKSDPHLFEEFEF